MRGPRGRSALWFALALAVMVPILTRAGFTAGSRSLLLVLAGPVLLLAIVVAEDAAVRGARSAPVLALWALAAMAILSAAWTIGAAGDAARWGFVLAGYGALAVGGAAVARQPGGVVALAAGLCALALIAGLTGLVAAGARAEPYALRIGGSWRPASFFEYPPALALLQAAALAPLLTAMTRATRRVAVAAAAIAAVAAATLALADSRFALAAGAVIAMLALLRPGAPAGARAAAATLLAVTAALAGLLAGGRAELGETAGDAPRLLGLALIVAVVPLVWWWVPRSAPAGRGGRVRQRPAALAVAGVALAALVVALAPAFDPAAVGGERRGGFTHGRLQTWEAAIDVWRERPLLGHGGDTFLLATRGEQPGRAIRYAHNLPLEVAVELGLAGLLAVLALYASSARLLLRARGSEAAQWLGPLVAVFLLANLVDWTWRLAGLGALWAVALGAVTAAASAGAARPFLPQGSRDRAGSPPAVDNQARGHAQPSRRSS